MSRTPPSSIALAPWSDCNDDADCPSPPTLHASDNIPDGGYGWVCVAACFSVNCFTWGVVAVSQLSVLPLRQSPTRGLRAPLRLSLMLCLLPQAKPSACSPMVSTLRVTCVKTIIPMPGSLTTHSLEASTSRWQCLSPRLSPSLLANSVPSCAWQSVPFCWRPASSVRRSPKRSGNSTSPKVCSSASV